MQSSQQPPRAGSPSGNTGNDKVITCGMCFNLMSEPATLSCGHSFCTKCIRAKLDMTANADGFLCPMCNFLHQEVNMRTLQDLQDPGLTARIALLQKGTEGRPICQWCEEAPATLHCSDCMYALCSECNVAVHKNSAKRHHHPQLIQDGRSIRNTSKKCSIPGHEEYRLEFYCVKCECLCCAYCLQVGPHRGHDNVLVTKAAAEVRAQMGRDLENLGTLKARIDGMANELNRVHGQYNESYDTVEQTLTNRFASFRQQLATKEMESRKILAELRKMGDGSLSNSREQFLFKLNSINTASLNFKRLQNGGADYEVLQNRAAMSAFLRMEAPNVSGTGFRLSDNGDLNVVGMELSLDLNSANDGGVSAGRSASNMNQAPGNPLAGGPASGIGAANGNGNGVGGSSVARELQLQRPNAYNFTFQPDHDVEMMELADGVAFRCIDRPSSEHVGVFANETFDSIRSAGLVEATGAITWRVRLDLVSETFVGVVDSVDENNLDGFYWRPMRQGFFDGKAGRPTPTLKNLPVCRNGDILKFTYDLTGKVLKLSINNNDKGIIVTDLHAHFAPCFVFRPGEAVTFLA